MAVTEFRHYELLAARLRELGVDPRPAMEPFVAALDAFHERTAPYDWLEGLVKAYVGDGIADGLLPRGRGVRRPGDPRRWCSRCSRTPGTPSSPSTGCARRSRPTRGWPAGSPCGAGGWSARRSRQAQRVAAERDALAALLVGGLDAGADLAEVGRMFARLTDKHTRRMAAARPVGLSACPWPKKWWLERHCRLSVWAGLSARRSTGGSTRPRCCSEDTDDQLIGALIREGGAIGSVCGSVGIWCCSGDSACRLIRRLGCLSGRSRATPGSLVTGSRPGATKGPAEVAGPFVIPRVCAS